MTDARTELRERIARVLHDAACGCGQPEDRHRELADLVLDEIDRANEETAR